MTKNETEIIKIWRNASKEDRAFMKLALCCFVTCEKIGCNAFFEEAQEILDRKDNKEAIKAFVFRWVDELQKNL